MEDKVVSIEEKKADAELMSAWLGVDELIIDPKLLFDIQTLLCYYSEFLCPNDEVTVEYPVEGIPCASVDDKRVLIPLKPLLEGKVDNAIASVIHELHHIKYSLGEKEICQTIYPYLHKVLTTLETEHCGQKMCVWDVVTSEGTIHSGEIIDRTSKNKYAPFMYTLMADLFLLMNAFEDIRIDEKQPTNLVKYRVKQEEECFNNFKEHLDTNLPEMNDFHGMLFRSLFHYKGWYDDLDVAKYNLSPSLIMDSDAKGLYPPVFRAFASLVQDLAGGLWEKFREETGTGFSAIDEFMAQELGGDDGNFGDGAKECEELEIGVKPTSSCPAPNSEMSSFAREVAEEDIALMYGDTEGYEDKGRKVLSQDAWSEIQAFKQIQHTKCREKMENYPQGISYDTLVVDTYA
jgi:hypothetical protein